MPELPEVEVVKRSLSKKIQNLIIKKVKINDENLRYKVNRDELSKLVGKRIKNIKRRSKYLIFKIGKNKIMLVHLGMTGKFFFINNKKTKYKTSFYYSINENKDKKHDHIIFNLSNNQKLIYNDIRKFGFIKFFKKNKLEDSTHLKYLGPEPLSTKFNLRYFKDYIYGKEKAVKNLLMDQKFVAGLGNIYANEILFFSGVKPYKRIKKLSDNEIKNIIKLTKKIITKAIILGGSSIRDFSSSSGKKGSFQQHFSVYSKKGKKCIKKNCNGIIKKIVISNRSTFYCNKCQK